MNQTQVRGGETTPVNQADARMRPFRTTVLVTLVLLVIQYVLGMIANLDIQYPAGNLWRWVFGNSPLIVLHIINGTLLIVAAIVALVLSITRRHTAGIIAAIAGLVLLVFAWLSGAQFLATQQNDLSLRMALSFIGAFIAYLLGYYLSKVPSQKKSI